ncbi:GGDEF domain-containing protein [Vibrio vulnificus]|nr:GGDEF domain-containing protein [Vibrio vulnificus]
MTALRGICQGMTFVLDLRTLCVITAAICLSYGVGLALFNRAHIKRHNLMTFVCALTLIGMATALIGLRGVVSDFFSIVAANVMLYTGFSFFLYGFSQFRQINNRFSALSFALIVPLTLSFIYFTYLAPSLNTRLIIISSFLSLTLYMTAYNVHRGSANDTRLPVNVIVTSFCIVGTIELIRAINFILVPEDRFFNASQPSIYILQLSYLLGTLNVTITAFSLVWLINERLLTSLQEMSLKDNLTGFFNRHGLEQKLPAMISSAQHRQQPLIAMMCDIDHFKLVNDTYGHQEGDIILQRCAEAIRAQLPQQHLAFRYGGEEFLIILSQYELVRAKQLAETIRMTIEQSQFVQLPERHLTMSFGLTELSTLDNVESMVKRADQALYLAKSQGRNQVVVHQ